MSKFLYTELSVRYSVILLLSYKQSLYVMLGCHTDRYCYYCVRKRHRCHAVLLQCLPFLHMAIYNYQQLYIVVVFDVISYFIIEIDAVY